MIKMKEYNINGIWKKKNSTEPVMYVVLEYVSGGELFDFISFGGRLPMKICRFYFH